MVDDFFEILRSPAGNDMLQPITLLEGRSPPPTEFVARASDNEGDSKLELASLALLNGVGPTTFCEYCWSRVGHGTYGNAPFTDILCVRSQQGKLV